MSIKTTQLIRCDHIHKDGDQCTVERTVTNIPVSEPMYHLTMALEVIDADGTRQMVQEDVHLCYWDLYYHLSSMHDQAKTDVEARKALARQTEIQLEAVDIGG